MEFYSAALWMPGMSQPRQPNSASLMLGQLPSDRITRPAGFAQSYFDLSLIGTVIIQ